MVATGNPGKLREFEELLRGRGLQLEGRDTGVEEVGETYEANAALKAEAAAAASGLPALGDDSGLEVEALAGFPGVHSARLAHTQEERTRLLLARLSGLPRPWKARFVCVVALTVPGRGTRTFRGERRGEVVEPRERGHGFGYDPVFQVSEVGRTFAEMDPAEKDRWSHRGAAVRAMMESGALAALGGDPLK